MSQSGTFEAWFNSLPSVEIETLDIENRICGICRVDYSPSSENRHPEDPVEQPVRLPCGHVFGQLCLREWLSPAPQGSHNNTCPTCRFRLSEREHSPSVYPVMEEHLPYLQWLATLDFANDGDRRFVLGTLAYTLNERDSRYQFSSRVERERRNQIERVELIRRILQLQQRGMELSAQLYREEEQGFIGAAMPREREEQLRSEISETMLEALELVVREASLTRYEAFLDQGDDEQDLVGEIRRVVRARARRAQEDHDY